MAYPIFGISDGDMGLYFWLIATITIVASPIGLGLIEYSKFLFTPFSKAMVSKSELNIEQNKLWKAYSMIIRILYFPFGLVYFIIGVFQVAGLFISIIGIPCAIVVAKSLGTYFNPVNKKCVPVAVKQELENRKGQDEVRKFIKE